MLRKGRSGAFIGFLYRSTGLLRCFILRRGLVVLFEGFLGLHMGFECRRQAFGVYGLRVRVLVEFRIQESGFDTLMPTLNKP